VLHGQLSPVIAVKISTPSLGPSKRGALSADRWLLEGTNCCGAVAASLKALGTGKVASSTIDAVLCPSETMFQQRLDGELARHLPAERVGGLESDCSILAVPDLAATKSRPHDVTIL